MEGHEAPGRPDSGMVGLGGAMLPAAVALDEGTRDADSGSSSARRGARKPWTAGVAAADSRSLQSDEFSEAGELLDGGSDGRAAAGEAGDPEAAGAVAVRTRPSRFGPDGAAAGGEAGDGTIEQSSIFRSWTDPGDSSSAAGQCRFLLGIGPDGRLVPAVGSLNSHRCAAFGDPLTLSLRQQDLVCLQPIHVSCPRFLRGTLLETENAVATAPVLERRVIPRATLAGLILVVVAVAVSFVAVLTGFLPTGGLPGASSSAVPSARVAAVASPSAPAGVQPTSPATATPAATTPVATPTARITESPTPSATPPAPTPTPSPTVVRTPTPAPPPTPRSSWPPGATASRMSLVRACPGVANCYLYTIRPDDKLWAIADYFGVKYATVLAWNPWITDPASIRVGDVIKIPPPTR